MFSSSMPPTHKIEAHFGIDGRWKINFDTRDKEALKFNYDCWTDAVASPETSHQAVIPRQRWA